MERKTMIGAALFVLGALLFVPSALPTSEAVWTIALAPAAVVLAAGTYLLGTSEGGRPV